MVKSNFTCLPIFQQQDLIIQQQKEAYMKLQREIEARLKRTKKKKGPKFWTDLLGYFKKLSLTHVKHKDKESCESAYGYPMDTQTVVQTPHHKSKIDGLSTQEMRTLSDLIKGINIHLLLT